MRKGLFILLVFFVATSCHHRRYPDKKIFRYNESKGITSLDPAFAKSQTNIWPVHQLFNGLVQLDKNLNIQPCIAKRWSISADGKIYSFVLRQDVWFHNDSAFAGNTRKVVATDFVYSLNRIIDPTVSSPGSWIFNMVNQDTLNHGFFAANDTTFQIFLKTPFPGFLGLLSMPYCSVVPREAIKRYGNDFRSHPVGTGPFKFKYWQEGEKLIFVKNKNYFEKDPSGNRLPYLDAVNISFIADKQSEFLEFLKGNLDFISGVNANNRNELLTRDGNLNPAYNGRFHLFSQPYLNTEYLGFLLDSSKINPAYNALLDKRIRQAINYGFDRKKMLKYLRNNVGTPAEKGFIPCGLPGYGSTKGFTYNPQKAKALLKAAGYPNGKGLPEIKLTTTSDYLDLCEFLQHDLENIGIHLSLEVSTGASFRDFVANSKLPFFRGSWIADYPDAENYLALFYSKNFSPGGPNYTHFHNAVYDSLYEKSMQTTNDSIRIKIYKKMDQIIIDNAVIVPLYYDRVIDFTQNNIVNFETNPLNLLELKYINIKP